MYGNQLISTKINRNYCVLLMEIPYLKFSSLHHPFFRSFKNLSNTNPILQSRLDNHNLNCVFSLSLSIAREKSSTFHECSRTDLEKFSLIFGSDFPLVVCLREQTFREREPQKQNRAPCKRTICSLFEL